MLKRFAPFAVALVVPYLIFVLVIGLNESDLDIEKARKRELSFDVQKQQVLRQQKPKKKEEVRRRRVADALPSIKPANLGSDLGGSGLSFGVPLFDEAEFASIGDNGLLDSTINRAMDDGSVDTPPKVRKRSPIVYPELARRQGVSGYVEMNVLIDEEGNVEDINIVDSKPKEIFDLTADSTMRAWKFEPATYNGKKVKVWAMQKIVFKLN